jgi:hypothetical protein
MDIALLAVALHGDRDALDELALDGLAIGRGAGDGMPERWNIPSQLKDRRALLGRKAKGVLSHKVELPPFTDTLWFKPKKSADQQTRQQ